MKPRIRVDAVRTPDGEDMVLYQHDRDFSIQVSGHELMHSRQHESELELARLGCAHLVSSNAPRVLIGGLGLGYTLRETLDLLGPGAEVRVGELLPSIADWSHKFTGALTGQPLDDTRVTLKLGDVVTLIEESPKCFDAILLDIDNGPIAFTDAGNDRLYGREGLCACRAALRDDGCLAVWSAEASKPFEQRLMACGFHVRRYRVPAYKGSRSQSRFIWVASEQASRLPPGGGEPRPAPPPVRGHRRRRGG